MQDALAEVPGTRWEIFEIELELGDLQRLPEVIERLEVGRVFGTTASPDAITERAWGMVRVPTGLPQRLLFGVVVSPQSTTIDNMAAARQVAARAAEDLPVLSIHSVAASGLEGT